MRICIKCKKREGGWWDHLCAHCKRTSVSSNGVSEYKKNDESEGILSVEQINLLNALYTIKYNKIAVGGFIISLLGILGVGLAGIIGFIMGIVALVQMKYVYQKGKGLAISAIIIGFIWSFGIGIINILIKAGY